MDEHKNPSPEHAKLFSIFLELLAEPSFQALVAAVKPQHLEFLMNFWDSQSPGFAKRNKAAELAGYAGEPGSAQLSGQGTRVLKNPQVQRVMAAVFERAGCTLELDAKVIFEAMTATRTRYFMGENNTIISTPAEPDHATRLRGLVIKDRLLRAPSAVTHQNLPSADSGGTTATAEDQLCAGCSEAVKKVATLSATDRAVLREVVESDVKLANSAAPKQDCGGHDEK